MNRAFFPNGEGGRKKKSHEHKQSECTHAESYWVAHLFNIRRGPERFFRRFKLSFVVFVASKTYQNRPKTEAFEADARPTLYILRFGDLLQGP